jgi:hypothetical protein
MGRVDPGQRKNKNGYYRNFKLDSGVDLGQDSGREWGWLLTWVNLRIKVILIIILKPDLMINSG